MAVTLASVLELLNGEPLTVRGSRDSVFDRASRPPDADGRSIVWIRPGTAGEAGDFNAALVVCAPRDADELSVRGGIRSLLVVEEPRRVFSRIVNHFLVSKPAPGIHPTAFIHEGARLGKNCHIGPFSYIGDCVIGDHALIYGHCMIHDGAVIGEQAVLHAGVVIGSDGFGFTRDATGKAWKFPHLGNVVIGNHVEIGANSCIDRGALGNTVIGNGVKIDNLVHIAHNVEVGEDAFIIANAMVGGGVRIGRGAWMAPSASVLQQLTIGAGATVGMGAVVTHSVPEGETWAGVPARRLEKKS